MLDHVLIPGMRSFIPEPQGLRAGRVIAQWEAEVLSEGRLGVGEIGTTYLARKVRIELSFGK